MTLLLFALLMQTPGFVNSELAATGDAKAVLVVPVGTVIPINLTSRISTKHAREGDGIYAQTAVPIAVNDQIVIPAGSFIRGKVGHVEQPGRIKGRAEMTFSFQQI